MHSATMAPLGLPALYRATTGQQRPFHGIEAAQAYDAGWNTFPACTGAELGSPEWMGWADHRDASASAADMDDTCAWAATHPADIGLHA